MIDQQYTPLSPRGQQNVFRAHSAQLEPVPSWVLPAGLRDMLPLFLDFSPDGLIMIDETGTIALVNTHVERLFGYGKEELIGQSLEILLPERIRAAHATHLAQYMSDPHLRPVGRGLNLLGRRKDGREFPMEIGLQPIWIGQPLYVVAAVRDVTAQCKIQREREQLTERVRLQSELINLAHDAILVHDPDGHIVSWNRGHKTSMDGRNRKQ